MTPLIRPAILLPAHYGVITHAHGPIREIAKHAAAFAGDHGLPSAADGMPLSAPP